MDKNWQSWVLAALVLLVAFFGSQYLLGERSQNTAQWQTFSKFKECVYEQL